MEINSATLQYHNGLKFYAHQLQETGARPSKEENSKDNSNSIDKVTISKEAKEKGVASGQAAGEKSTDIAIKNEQELSVQELTQLRTLKRRDIEVRNHEQAHLSVAGKYAKGGASFVFTKGPDGGSYAVGGEVAIDTSAETSPEATIAKMQTIKRAALAPLNPSSTDRNIAARAATKEAVARQQLIKQQHEELLPDSPGGNSKLVERDKPPQDDANMVKHEVFTKLNTHTTPFETVI